MNDLKSYSDEEVDDADGEKVIKQENSKSDLSWLAPPARMINGKPDREWGLGQVKTSSSFIGGESEESKPSFEALSAKLAYFHSLKEKGTHFNQSLANNRSFKNPHIYAKLVEWLDVDETASAYKEMMGSSRIEDGDDDDDNYVNKIWTSTKSAREQLLSNASSEKIAQLQKQRQEEIDEEKRKLRGKRDKIDFTPSGSSGRKDEDSKKRRHDDNDHSQRSYDSDRHRNRRDREREEHSRSSIKGKRS